MTMSLTPKLPFSGHAKGAEKEESLTTLLDTNQCADLTFLIATITAAMRQSLLDIFTAEEIPSYIKTAKIEAKVTMGEPSTSDILDPNREDKEKEIKEKQSREELSRREIAKPAAQELKREMLKHFDEWRGNVIGRVGEVVNSREAAHQQTREVNDREIGKAIKESEPDTKSVHNLETKDQDEEKTFRDVYPPLPSKLTLLEEDKRVLILHAMILILLSLEQYSSHSRILLLHLTSSLHVKLSVLKKDEEKIAQGLLEAASHNLNADAETKKAAESSHTARKWKVGLAGVVGAAAIGVTGGLAAPFIAAGLGTVMGGLGLGATAAAGYLGTLAGSSVLVGGLFGGYGALMTSKAMDDYAREVEDFAFIPIHRSQDPARHDPSSRRLRVAIAASGWLREPDEVHKPWRYIGMGTEGFALRWELDALLELGHSLETFITSAAWGYAKKKIIERTLFATLSAALWPLHIVKIAGILDNPFSVAKYRADKAGAVLADALINKVQGERPVTLVGYSLGARLIFTCCQKLAERKAFGLIENVIVLGSPVPSDSEDWRPIRAVVSGRVVNVFSTHDYVLAFLYRTSSIQLGVAGLQPILGVRGVQNVDLSELVDGHLQYRFITGSVLRKIGFEDVDITEVERAEVELKKHKQDIERERLENEGKNPGEGEGKEKLEREVKEKSEQSIFHMMQDKTKNLDITSFLNNRKEDNQEQEKAQEKAEVK